MRARLFRLDAGGVGTLSDFCPRSEQAIDRRDANA